MSDQTVSVPLSRLRVMPHVGAPVLVAPGIRGVLCEVLPQDGLAVYCADTGETFVHVRGFVALDISAPTSASIDGATVAATMLAEAAGLDVSWGVCWSADRDDPFDRGRAAVTIRAATGSAIRRYSERTDATDPRAILAAVLVAVLGVTS